MNKFQLKYHYLDGSTLTVTNKSLSVSIQIALRASENTKSEPIKVQFITTGKTLFFDKSKFLDFLAGNISNLDLIAATQCDGLFRNKVDIQTNNQTIDAGALWKLCQNKYILIDDDQYIAVIAPDDNFVEV